MAAAASVHARPVIRLGSCPGPSNPDGSGVVAKVTETRGGTEATGGHALAATLPPARSLVRL